MFKFWEMVRITTGKNFDVKTAQLVASAAIRHSR